MNAQVAGLVPVVPAVVVTMPGTEIRTVEELHEEIIRDTTALQEVALEDLTEDQQAQMESLVAKIGGHLQKLRQARYTEGLTGT